MNMKEFEKWEIDRLLELIYKATNPNNSVVICETWEKRKDADKIKPIFDMFAEAFITLHSICVLILSKCWVQAGAITRVAIEQVAALRLLTSNSELMESYLDLYKLRSEFYRLKSNEISCFKEKHNLKEKIQSLNKYFDYSWINSLSQNGTYSRNELVEKAQLAEFLEDIENTLNKAAHGKITMFDLAGSNSSWSLFNKYCRRLAATCFKLFDFLCCSYYVWTSQDEFDRATGGVFIEFKKIYLSKVEPSDILV